MTSKHYESITFEMRVSIESYVIEGRIRKFMTDELGVDATSISRELSRSMEERRHIG